MSTYLKYISTFIFGVVITLVAPITSTVFAQQTATGCYTTQMGSPNGTPIMPPGCGEDTGTSNNDLVKAAEALKAAYGTCLGGKTNSGANACMDQQLTQAGFSAAQVKAFDTRRSTSISHSGCTECLGFVGIALSLLSTDTSALLGPNTAKDILNMNSFKVGSNTYVKQPQGTLSQPGDVGIAGTTVSTGGHALIVKEAQGNIKFIAVEANWTRCTATDTIAHNEPAEQFYFYRKQ